MCARDDNLLVLWFWYGPGRGELPSEGKDFKDVPEDKRDHGSLHPTEPP